MEAPESLIGKGIECPTCRIKSIVELPKVQTPAEDARAEQVRKAYQNKIRRQQMELSPEARRGIVNNISIGSGCLGLIFIGIGFLLVVASGEPYSDSNPFGGYTMSIMGAVFLAAGFIIKALSYLIPPDK